MDLNGGTTNRGDKHTVAAGDEGINQAHTSAQYAIVPSQAISETAPLLPQGDSILDQPTYESLPSSRISIRARISRAHLALRIILLILAVIIAVLFIWSVDHVEVSVLSQAKGLKY
jgi:NADH:ubiquinone oxidoreductase subunit 3 (subunit A)